MEPLIGKEVQQNPSLFYKRISVTEAETLFILTRTVGYQRLARKGALPRNILCRPFSDGDDYLLSMQNIPGFSLDRLPEEQIPYFHSIDFAKQMAGTFCLFQRNKVFQTDWNAGNVMYNTRTNRLTTVDPTSVVAMPDMEPFFEAQMEKPNLESSDYVHAFSRCLIHALTGVDTPGWRVLVQADPGNYLKPWNFAEFQALVNNPGQQNLRFNQLVNDSIPFAIRKQLSLGRIDSRLIDFLVKASGFDDKTDIPQDFSELFAI